MTSLEVFFIFFLFLNYNLKIKKQGEIIMNFDLKQSVLEQIKRVVNSEVQSLQIASNHGFDPFDICEVCDSIMDNVEEVKMFLVSIKTIYFSLDYSDKQKPIYLNLETHDKFAYASHKQEYLLLPDPLNGFLHFTDCEELEECAIKLMESYAFYQEESKSGEY